MALNVQTFRTRTITAIVFVIIMFGGLLLNKWLFLSLFGIIMIGALAEFFKICRLIWKKNISYYIPLALLYIVLPVSLVIDLGIQGDIKSDFSYSPLFPCVIFFSIWINDTMAYIVGSFIGKTPFSKISPKKTWEGTIGGAILCVVVMALLSFVFPNQLKLKDLLIISSLCAVFGTLGDLLESKLKRMAAIKDSGNIMPGHGGFLDRFDSFLVATPIVWAYVNWMM